MDLVDLSRFINNCRKYKKRIEYIAINTTSRNSNHYNFYYTAILNIPYTYSLNGKLNKRNKACNDIHEIINGGSRDYIKVECDNNYDRLVKMSIVSENLQQYSQCKVIAFYKDFELEHNCYDKYIKVIHNDLKECMKKELLKNDLFIDSIIDLYWNKYYEKYVSKINYRRYMEIKNKLSEIEKIIEKNKNSYILSKLTGGELKTSDVKNYPELIKTMDELTKIKLLVS